MRHTTRSRARLGAALAAPLAAVLLLGGCAAGSFSPSSEYAEPAVAPGGAPDFASDSGGASSPEVRQAEGDRSVITTGWATVLVDDPAAAVEEAIRIVEAAGGRVDGRSQSGPTDYSGGRANVTLRIPSAKLSSVLEQLEALGVVQEVSLSSSDVTLQVRDLDARISAMRASIERLTDLLAQATDIEDLIALETAISDRQAQLESMLAEQRWLGDLVSLSTLEVGFVTERVVDKPAPDNFFDGLVRGWEALVGFMGGLLVVLGFLLPWLIPFAIIGVIVLVIVRVSVGRRLRREEAAGEGVAEAPAEVTASEAADPADPAGPEAP